MFETLLRQLVSGAHGIRERAEGVAFLKVAQSTYPIAGVTYVGLNIPICPDRKRFVQCTLSDQWAKQGISTERVSADRLAGLAAALRGPLHWPAAIEAGESQALRRLAECTAGEHILSFPLRKLDDETALLCVAGADADWQARKNELLAELQILGNYFHQHMMRIHGHDASKEMLVTARELDCLKWMAAGKTAWEVSVILGISERTVRFHLNAAREKLDCLTTTQAVAKAVSQQLISV